MIRPLALFLILIMNCGAGGIGPVFYDIFHESPEKKAEDYLDRISRDIENHEAALNIFFHGKENEEVFVSSKVLVPMAHQHIYGEYLILFPKKPKLSQKIRSRIPFRTALITGHHMLRFEFNSMSWDRKTPIVIEKSFEILSGDELSINIHGKSNIRFGKK